MEEIDLSVLAPAASVFASTPKSLLGEMAIGLQGLASPYSTAEATAPAVLGGLLSDIELDKNPPFIKTSLVFGKVVLGSVSISPTPTTVRTFSTLTGGFADSLEVSSTVKAKAMIPSIGVLIGSVEVYAVAGAGSEIRIQEIEDGLPRRKPKTRKQIKTAQRRAMLASISRRF